MLHIVRELGVVNLLLLACAAFILLVLAYEKGRAWWMRRREARAQSRQIRPPVMRSAGSQAILTSPGEEMPEQPEYH